MYIVTIKRANSRLACGSGKEPDKARACVIDTEGDFSEGEELLRGGE
jgi:hypothetical protein